MLRQKQAGVAGGDASAVPCPPGAPATALTAHLHFLITRTQTPIISTTPQLSHEEVQENSKVHPDRHTEVTCPCPLRNQQALPRRCYTWITCGCIVKKRGFHIIPSFKTGLLHKASWCLGSTSCSETLSSVWLRLYYSIPYDNNSN